jgi:ribose 5-phosphate isomerase B
MTTPISNEEIHDIVQRVVSKTLETQTLVENKDPAAQTAEKLEDKNKRGIVAIGTDHGGVDLKEILKRDLAENGYQVIDVGTHTKDSVDYPDIAFAVAQLVAEGKAWRGVVIDGAGIGSCMAANKVPGVRAAMCYDYATAVNSREHNNANVLTLGAGLIGINLAKQILNTWLTTQFGGGRHARRVDKITAIMDQFIKNGK